MPALTRAPARRAGGQGQARQPRAPEQAFRGESSDVWGNPFALQVTGRHRFGSSDGQTGQDAIQPTGHSPVRRPDEVHQAGHQQAADEQGVNQYREAQPEAELRQLPGAANKNDPKTRIMMPAAAAMIGPLLA